MPTPTPSAIDRLVLRNNILEDELRQTTERAAKAEASVLFLAERLCNESRCENNKGDVHSASIRSDLGKLQAELVDLRATFAKFLEEGSRTRHAPDPLSSSGPASHVPEPPDSGGSTPRVGDAMPSPQSLLDIEPQEVANGDIGSYGADTLREGKSDDGGYDERVDRSHSALAHELSTGARIVPDKVQQWSAAPLGQSKANGPGLSRHFSIPAKAHNSIAGYATFIEDMNEEEKTRFWRQQATIYKSNVHSTHWRAYYETEIRPKYLARMDQTRGHVNFNDDSASTSKVNAINRLRPGQREQDVAGIPKSTASRYEHQPRSKAGIFESDWAVKEVLLPAKSTRMLGMGHAQQGFKGSDQQPNSTIDRGSQTQTTTGSRVNMPAENRDDLCLPIRRAEPPRHWPDERLEVCEALNGPANGLAAGNALESPLSYAGQTDVSKTRPTRRCTVIIGRIPVLVKLAEVVSKICGGRLRSATMCRTAGMKTIPHIETNTAMAVFLEPESAHAFAQFCQVTPLTFLDRKGRPSRAEVTLLTTHTRHLESSLIRLATDEKRLTRVLFMNDSTKQWTPESVVEEITQYFNRAGCAMARDPDRHSLKHLHTIPSPLVRGTRLDGLLYFEFASMRDAKWALDLIESSMKRVFQGVERGFLLDPCDTPCVSNQSGLSSSRPEKNELDDNSEDLLQDALCEDDRNRSTHPILTSLHDGRGHGGVYETPGSEAGSLL